MSSDRVKAFVEKATEDQLALWLALVHLCDALDRVSQEQRETAAEAVFRRVSEHREMQVWREAVADWEW